MGLDDGGVDPHSRQTSGVQKRERTSVHPISDHQCEFCPTYTLLEYSPEMTEDFRANLGTVTAAMKSSWRERMMFWSASADNRAWAKSNARKKVLHLEQSDPVKFEDARQAHENGVGWYSYAIYLDSARSRVRRITIGDQGE
jgi:hypothetical protein